MAYTYSDVNGNIGYGPSINGWRQVKKLIASQPNFPRPALNQFIEYGHTNMLPALSVECRYLASQTDNQDIKDTLTHLAAMAVKADEIIVLEC